MMAAILNPAVLDSDLCTKRTSLIHSDSTWWWQPSWILPFWIQPFCTKLWLKLVQSDSNSFILTQLDDGSHLELCHLGFSHFAQKELHSFILTQLDDGSHLEFCHVGFKMAAINKLSQNDWVNFFLYKMAESRMADFKIAAIIKLSQNEWVKFFVQMLGTNLGKCEWVWEDKLRWLDPRWQNSRGLPSLS